MSRLGLVGAGAVGPALAKILAGGGFEVGVVASRRIEAARDAVAFLGAGTPSDRNPDAAADADLLILAVPDRAIAAVAEEIAAAGAVKAGSLAIHLSGALSSAVLAPLAAAGAQIGSLHPLQSFASREIAVERLRDAWIFHESPDPARTAAVARRVSPHVAALDPDAKVLYHAGAAAASNLVVAMVDLGVALMEAAGIDREAAWSALLPLVLGTAENLEKVGLPGALTGPVARGDGETIRAHLAKMRERSPDLLLAYTAASLHAIRVAEAKGTLDAESAAELRRILIVTGQ